MKKETTIVYMVAGISSRFEGKVKQFVQVGPDGQTLIEYSLDQALKAGFDRIIFIVGNKTEKLFKEKFGRAYKGKPIEYAYQFFDEKNRDRPWGTCDAVCSIKEIINTPFVVCNGDDIYGTKTFKRLHDHIINKDSSASIGYDLEETLPELGKTNRGIFSLDDKGKAINIKEYFNIEKDKLEDQGLRPKDRCSMNIYALKKETIYLLNKRLEEFKRLNANDRTKECLIQHELSGLLKEGSLEMEIIDNEEEWVGVTNPEDEKIVREILSKDNIRMTIVYMVAGISSRFGGKIKQFAMIGPKEESLIEYSLDQAIDTGFNRIIFIVGNKTEHLFKKRFGLYYKGVPIEYAYQRFDPDKRDRPWGTCDAVCSIKYIIDTPFVVCTGDEVYGKDKLKTLYDHLTKTRTEATIGCTIKENIPEKGSVNRGIFSVDKNNNVLEINETLGITKEDIGKKYDPETLTSISIFALHKDTIDLLDIKLKKFKEKHSEDRKIECYLPEKLTELIKENKITMRLYPSRTKVISLTNPEDEEIARRQLSISQ